LKIQKTSWRRGKNKLVCQLEGASGILSGATREMSQMNRISIGYAKTLFGRAGPIRASF
jgi:hypothetical protein